MYFNKQKIVHTLVLDLRIYSQILIYLHRRTSNIKVTRFRPI